MVTGEILLMFIILGILIGFVWWRSSDVPRQMIENQKRLSAARQKVAIAEKKYMRGKIKKTVFDELLNDLESEIVASEMALFRLNHLQDISVDDKAEEIFGHVANPTKRKKVRLAALLKETELLRQEMGMLEGRLMKRQITQSVFEKMITTKERAMIEKEAEIMGLVGDGKKQDAAEEKSTEE